MMEWLFLLSFLVLMVLRLPIAFAMGVSSLIYLLGSGISLHVIPQIMVATHDDFVLISIPLFMLAGELMNSGGITERLFNFANKMVGHIRGGLSHVNVLASLIFAGMSGSAVADAAGLGQIEIKAMVDEGFDPDFSAAITAASSTVGPIIPPSIPFVIYGAMTGVSIGDLFLGGMIPGLLMALAMSFACYVISVRRGYPCHERASTKERMAAFMKAIPSLVTPLIIFGGIIFGVCTPTEAAVLAVIYAMILGGLVYKEFSFRELVRMVLNVAVTTASIEVIVCLAGVFGYILAYQGIPQAVAAAILSISTNKYVILFLLTVMLLVIGCFMETIAVILILVPMLMPVLDAVGISRLHFGVLMTLNLMIGLITPPVGVNLFVVANIAKTSFERVVKATMPFLVVLILVLFLITYVPGFVTFLPSIIR